MLLLFFVTYDIDKSRYLKIQFQNCVNIHKIVMVKNVGPQIMDKCELTPCVVAILNINVNEFLFSLSKHLYVLLFHIVYI